MLVTVVLASDDLESWNMCNPAADEPVSPATENLSRMLTTSRHPLSFRRVANHVDDKMYDTHCDHIQSYIRENNSLGLAINWRKSPLIMHMLAAIILMNPDRKNLKAREKVRQLRQQYAYLLRRLLFQESVLKARDSGVEPPSDSNALYHSNITHIERAERVFNLLFSRTYDLGKNRDYYMLYFYSWAHLMDPLVHQILNIKGPFKGPPPDCTSAMRDQPVSASGPNQVTTDSHSSDQAN